MTENKKTTYTCTDYRQEMILLGLQRRLNTQVLSPAEKETLLEEIQKLEKVMGLD